MGKTGLDRAGDPFGSCRVWVERDPIAAHFNADARAANPAFSADTRAANSDSSADARATNPDSGANGNRGSATLSS